MNPNLEAARERLTHQLQKELVYFANRQNKTFSHSAVGNGKS